jgi:hypothetical protein
MKKQDIKENIAVIDRWFPEWGTGRITKVKNTVFTVIFGNKEIKYDYPHARFLEKCN